MRRNSSMLWLILMASPVLAAQEPKRGAPPKSILTEEQKEILKNREILENLDLLEDFEKFRYFDYFALEDSADTSKEAQRPAAKKESKKEEKKKK